MKMPNERSKSWWKVVTSERHGDTFYIEAYSLSYTSDEIIADGVRIRIAGSSILDVVFVEGYLH